MENFFWEDEFYRDLEELICDISEEDDLSDLEDDWEIVVNHSKLEPMFNFNLGWIMNRVEEERDNEEGTGYEKLCKILKENINFVKINEDMPKFYYSDNKSKEVITKKDLLEWVS